MSSEPENSSKTVAYDPTSRWGRGEGTPIYKSDTRRKIEIKPLRETNVGVAEALTDPERRLN